jgi:RecA-family ATPase
VANNNEFHNLYPSVRYSRDMAEEPVEWLVTGLWQKSRINAMSGFEKSGKSRLMNWLLVGCAKDSCLGLGTGEEQSILYLCGEEPIATVNSRMMKYASTQGISDYDFNIDFVEAAAMRLDLKPQRLALLERLRDDGRNMLVIDPWRRVHGADENDSSQMAPLYNDLRRWSNTYGITVLIIHHTPKLSEDTDMSRIASWFRGSTDLPAILDCAQYVNRKKKDEIQVLRQGRFPPLAPLTITDLGGSKLGDDRGFQI